MVSPGGVGSREWGVGEKAAPKEKRGLFSHSPLPTPHPLLLYHFHAGWRCEAEKFGRYRAPREAGEVERCFVAVAVRIRDALNRVRGRRDRDGHVADHGGRGAWLERGDDVAAAR